MFARTTARLFTGAFKALFSDFDAFLRIVWAWYALVAVLGVLGTLLAANSFVVIFVTSGVWVCSSASIAVAWHRNLLLGERPGPVNLSFGRREIAYLGKTLLVSLIGLIPAIVVITIAGLFVTGWPGFIMAAGVMAFFILPSLMRLFLILPATALDEPLGIGDAYYRSEGLGLPMAMAAIGTGLCITAVDMLLSFVANTIGGGAVFAAIAVLILSLALQIALTALQIGILSGGYYILRERDMAPPAAPPAD
ncbi:hypothetical protein [Stappia sp. WLB 29]|uniref:hypothetical protein n=1 Tax=Stappia sp. WLB 29 TaxID=2925220 RepID=UPI0020BF82DD|nr:hypothetical protein [Stappia sp. WLB 29]